MKAETILVVDDERLIRWAIRSNLENDGYSVLEAGTVADATRTIEAHEPNLVLLDQLLPDGTGLQVLELLHDRFPDIAAIMITAIDTSGTAVRAMKLGAKDYITKPIDDDELRLVIERVLETARTADRYSTAMRQRDLHGGFHGLIGTSPPMQEVMTAIRKIGAAPVSTTLITGESGTGKELVARAIHALSDRADRPMLTVNCASISTSLMESELFGHEKGAFTDARNRKKGMFELADGGTLFLDEIGDLPPTLQAALLRVLEQRTFRRVGGEMDITVDVRIIAATNQPLHDKAREGTFRQDLYYRLNIMHIELPPLRERGEDVVLLAEHFVTEFNGKFRKSFKGLSEETKQLFRSHAWPGNVRELRNILERATLMDEGEYVFSHAVQLGHLHSISMPSDTPAPPETVPRALGSDALQSLEEIEKAAIVNALELAEHNQSKAARLLHISRDTLRYRLKKFGLS